MPYLLSSGHTKQHWIQGGSKNKHHKQQALNLHKVATSLSAHLVKASSRRKTSMHLREQQVLGALSKTKPKEHYRSITQGHLTLTVDIKNWWSIFSLAPQLSICESSKSPKTGIELPTLLEDFPCRSSDTRVPVEEGPQPFLILV